MNRDNLRERVLTYREKNGSMFFNYFGMKCDWCAMFVSYIMREVAEISDFPKIASCSAMKSRFNSKVNHDYKTAEIGDIVLFETHDPSDGPDHVGIVISNDISTGTITLIEGNTKGSNSGTWYLTSSVNTFTYNYSESSFDCIIDMSSYFTDSTKVESNTPTVNKTKIKELYAKYLEDLTNYKCDYNDYTENLEKLNNSIAILNDSVKTLIEEINKL